MSCQLPWGEYKPFPVKAIQPGQFYSWVYQQPTQRSRFSTTGREYAALSGPFGAVLESSSLHGPSLGSGLSPILRLNRCPIVDTLGAQGGQQWQYSRSIEASTEGITRALRPPPPPPISLGRPYPFNSLAHQCPAMVSSESENWKW